MTSPRWSVRTAEAQDAPQVASIFNEAWPLAQLGLADQVRDQPSNFFVVTEQEEVLGFINFTEWHNWPAIRGMQARDPDGHDALLIHWLAVRASRRNESIGQHLVRRWMAQLPMNIQYVILHPQPAGDADGTAADLRLRRFYTRLGFQLLPDPVCEETSYLLGWARAGVELPEPPPWPCDEPVASSSEDLIDGAAAAEVRALRRRLDESSTAHG